MLTSVFLQNLASTASELWPSVSAALQSSWRSSSHPSPPSASQHAPTQRAITIPNRIQNQRRDFFDSAQKPVNSTSLTSTPILLPDLLATVPMSALRPRPMAQALRAAPTAISIFAQG